MGQNSLRFELGELSENAWLGSGGEGHGAVDDVTGDNRAQMKFLCGWFLVHTRALDVSSVAENFNLGEWIKTALVDFLRMKLDHTSAFDGGLERAVPRSTFAKRLSEEIILGGGS